MTKTQKISNLTKQQKEAIGLLSIGTFLEYFDLLLYIHMIVLLNELFFPKTDPMTANLLSAFAFCSTYVTSVATLKAKVPPKALQIEVIITAGYCTGGLVISVIYIFAPITSPIEDKPCIILHIVTIQEAVIPI